MKRKRRRLWVMREHRRNLPCWFFAAITDGEVPERFASTGEPIDGNYSDSVCAKSAKKIVGRTLQPGEIVGFELVPIKPAKKARKK